MAGMEFTGWKAEWYGLITKPEKTVRVRLLIYKGNKYEIDKARNSDGVKGTMRIGNKYSVTSIELDPTRMTIRELLRVLFRRESKVANSE